MFTVFLYQLYAFAVPRTTQSDTSYYYHDINFSRLSPREAQEIAASHYNYAEEISWVPPLHTLGYGDDWEIWWKTWWIPNDTAGA